jgi:tRNA 2-thiouridine synthesizing protein A
MPAEMTVDGSGLLCVALLLQLVACVRGVEPGMVVHVVATDPAAPLDLAVWCHMTGHTYLGPVPDPGRTVFALRLAADARAARPDAPWRLAGEGG